MQQTSTASCFAFWKAPKKQFSSMNFEEFAERGNVDEMRKMMTADGGLKKNRINGALVCACMHGHLNVVQFILTELPKDFRPDVRSLHSFPLVEAVKNGHLDIVEFLCTEQVDIENHPELLHGYCNLEVFVQACMRGHLEIVKFLFSLVKTHNAKAALVDYNAFLLLRVAAKHEKILKFLLNVLREAQEERDEAEEKYLIKFFTTAALVILFCFVWILWVLLK